MLRRNLSLLVFLAVLGLVLAASPGVALAKPCPNSDCEEDILPGTPECPACGVPADATPEEIEQFREQQRQMEGGGEKRPETLIQGDGKLALNRRNEKILRVSGTAKLPDGAVISVSIGFNSEYNDPFVRQEVEVRAGQWELELGPWDKPVPAGFYFVELTFDLSEHMPDFRLRYQQKFGEDAHMYEYIHERIHFQVGTDEELEAQEAVDKQHYRDALDTALPLLFGIQDAYYAASVTRFEGNREDWKTWLGIMRYVAADQFDDEEAYAARLEALEDDSRFLSGDQFDAGAWRAWVDDDFRVKVCDLAKAHQEYGERWVASRFPKADTALSHVYRSLIALSATWSRDLYEKSGLELHDNDVLGNSCGPMEDRLVTIWYLDDLARKIMDEAHLNE